MAKIDSDGGPCFDSLRLSSRDQAQILSELNHPNQEPSAGNRRTGERVRYVVEAGLIVRMHHPGGSTVNYLVRARNLSPDGLGFLHGSFLHKGTKCVIGLKTLDSKAARVEGKVVRCQHIRGHIHDIGVRFDGKIRMTDFISSSLNVDPASEASTELPALSGRVLYVEDSISDQDLLKFHLDSVGVEVERVSNGIDALTAAKRTKFDTVITGVWLPGMSGPEIAECLRNEGYTGAIIALTSDEREETRIEALERGCTHVLVKPYKFEDLMKLLTEHLPVNHRAEGGVVPLQSELWGKESMRPLILTFLGRLEERTREIEKLLDVEGSGDLLQKLCRDIKGSAGGYGYPQISSAAQRLLQVSMESSPVDRLRQSFDEMSKLCRAACTKLEAAQPPSGSTVR